VTSAHATAVRGVAATPRPTLHAAAQPHVHRPAHPLRRVHQAGAPARPEMLVLPGQLWFGAGGPQGPVLRTLLGSCVAVTLWHAGRQLGGMCHYMLPSRQRAEGTPRDGRYGDEALAMLVDAMRRAGAQPDGFVAHLYGGADTLPDEANARLNIGERNIEQGWTLIDRHGFELVGVDVGDTVPRSVSLDMASGVVQMRRGAPT
jgi:chemotaxis protein CheD